MFAFDSPISLVNRWSREGPFARGCGISAGRAFASHARGGRFDPYSPHHKIILFMALRHALHSIALRRFETGRHAFVAIAGDVQVGWCIKHGGFWYIEDMDCKTLAGPFRTLAAADS